METNFKVPKILTFNYFPNISGHICGGKKPGIDLIAGKMLVLISFPKNSRFQVTALSLRPYLRPKLQGINSKAEKSLLANKVSLEWV